MTTQGDVSDLALSGTASRASTSEIDRRARAAVHARRAVAGSKSKSVASEAAAAEGPTVPNASDLPELPSRGPSDDEVPVPRPPQGVRDLVERVVATSPTKIEIRTL
jgi:hypothetical protein